MTASLTGALGRCVLIISVSAPKRWRGRLNFERVQEGEEGTIDLSWLGWKNEQDAWLSKKFPFLFLIIPHVFQSGWLLLPPMEANRQICLQI